MFAHRTPRFLEFLVFFIWSAFLDVVLHGRSSFPFLSRPFVYLSPAFRRHPAIAIFQLSPSRDGKKQHWFISNTTTNGKSEFLQVDRGAPLLPHVTDRKKNICIDIIFFGRSRAKFYLSADSHQTLTLSDPLPLSISPLPLTLFRALRVQGFRFPIPSGLSPALQLFSISSWRYH